MAINIVEILGTDSIAASRITINNNFTEIRDKVDPVLDTYDTNNGVINISDLPNGRIIAKGATITTAGMTIQGGSLTLGTTSDLYLNGGDLQLLSGTGIFDGGLVSNGIEIADEKISEVNDVEFLGTVINDSTVKRTMFISSSNTNDPIELQALSKTTEVFFINDNTSSVNLTDLGGSGILGNDATGTATNILIPANSSVILKFVIPSDSITGKWWVFGDTSKFVIS